MEEAHLPDIVLCSALSAGIAQARRQRRQRHPATVQTPGTLITNTDPDSLMKPLIAEVKQRSKLEQVTRLVRLIMVKLKAC